MNPKVLSKDFQAMAVIADDQAKLAARGGLALVPRARPGDVTQIDSGPSQAAISLYVGKKLWIELDTGTQILGRVLSISGGLMYTDSGIIRMDKIIYAREWADQR